MKRSVRFAGLVLVAVLSVMPSIPAFAAANGPMSAGSAGAAKPDAKYTWNVATIVPKGIGWVQQYEKLVAPTLNQISNQELKLKIHWGGIQGKDDEVIKKIKGGKLQGAGLDARGTVMAVKEFNVLELPFLFNNYDEVDHIRSKMRASFDKYAEKSGFFLALWIDQDFDQFYSSKYDFTDPKQFAQAHYANWCGDMEKRVLEVLGGAGSTTPADLNNFITMVSKGSVDSAVAPALWVVGTQLFSVFTSVNPMKIRYSPGSVLIGKKAWENLPVEYQKRYLEKRIGLETTMNQSIRLDNKKALAAMVRYGVKQTSTSEAGISALKEKTRKVWGEMTDNVFPKHLLDELTAKLAEFRKQKPIKAA